MRQSLKRMVVLAVFALGMTAGMASAAQFIRIGSGTVGGGYYTAGTSLASVLNATQKEINYSSITGGSIKNLVALDQKAIEFGLSLTSTLYEAWNGQSNFKEPIRTLRYVAAIYPQVAHIMVSGKDIQSIADLRGKKVDFGPIGGGIDTNNRLTLEAYGISESEVQIQRNSRSETAEALQTGATDAQVLLTAYPGSAINDMLSRGARLIAVEPDKRDEIVKKYPFYVPWDIPGGTYDGYDKDVTSFSAFCVMLTYESMDEEVVYKTVKAMFENTAALKDRSASIFGFFGIENAMAGCDIPLHPGAERYYREVGLIK